MTVDRPSTTDASAADTACRWIAKSDRKLTARDLESRLRNHFHCTRVAARRVVRDLVARGRLAYIYLYGQTYIDLGLRRPTRLSPRVVVCPPECTVGRVSDALTVVIAPGAAFGDGRHATTRLALNGLERVCRAPSFSAENGLECGIDIGTGSGILAIAAAGLGVARMDAVDTDPCARREARCNVTLNHLDHRIALIDQPLENLRTEYDLILANLRLPTLCRLAPWVGTHITPGGWLVFSGFRAAELPALCRAYPKPDYDLVWSRDSAGWCGAVLRTTGRAPS
jgi:ribosomal protein L11 methyltransferase